MNPYQDLLYCRQFMLCEKEIEDFQTWNIFTIDKYRLYVHPKLPVHTLKRNEKEIYLLGELYDYQNVTTTSEDILEKLIKADSFLELNEKCESYAGRFILIFKQNTSINIFNDSAAGRKVYYYVDGNTVCCATQAHVIAKYFDVKKSSRPEVLEFYQSPAFKYHKQVGVIENTSYDQIKLLLANHYFDVNQREAKRFWPHRKLNTMSLNEGVEKASAILQGLIKNIHHRNPQLSMAVTAGNDSRLLLSASREIAGDIFYYVHRLPLRGNDADMEMNDRITKLIGNERYIVEHNPEVDPDFKEIFMQNNEFPAEGNLPIIYNFMYKMCSDKLNIATTLNDVTRSFLTTYKKQIDGDLLAKLWDYSDIQYVIETYDQWLEETLPVLDEYGYYVLDIFNQEERITNWAAYYVSDSDIAMDEVAPISCRELFEIMLSVPSKYRDRHTNVFNRAMINHMWPEIGKLPYNPVFRVQLYTVLKKTHLFWPLRRLLKDR